MPACDGRTDRLMALSCLQYVGGKLGGLFFGPPCDSVCVPGEVIIVVVRYSHWLADCTLVKQSENKNIYTFKHLANRKRIMAEIRKGVYVWWGQVKQFCLQSALYAIPVVCPSVCVSVTRVDQSETVEIRIVQLSPQNSPMTLVSWWLTSPQNSKTNIGSGGAIWERGRKNMKFLANKIHVQAHTKSKYE